MAIKCSNCKHSWNNTLNIDVAECPRCGMPVPTGLEKRIRKEIEGYRNWLDYPKRTVGRAIGYAAAIYEFSTHNQNIDIHSVEDRLNKLGGDAGFEKSSIRMMASRSRRGYVDNRIGLMLYQISGNNNGFLYDMLYIVFRGSRGDAPGHNKNPYGAGWDTQNGQRVQIDWAANLTNNQVPAPWAPGVCVHAGFLELYESIRVNLIGEVTDIMAKNPHTKIVVTGHSLGAALAVLCAHDLQISTPYRPFCYPFCVPKTGNLAFARDFERRIATQTEVLECEIGRGRYSRAIMFVQGNDKVSWGSEHAHEYVNETNIQTVSNKTWGVGVTTGGVIQKAWFSMRPTRTMSKTQIYYLAPNVYMANPKGMHSYQVMEKDLLGKRTK